MLNEIDSIKKQYQVENVISVDVLLRQAYRRQ